MRDIFLTILVFGSLAFIIRRPYIGVLVWSWLSYMNPHRLAYGFAVTMPFAQIVAITLLASIIFMKEKISIPRSGVYVFWGAFILWMAVSTIFAIYPTGAVEQYTKVLKIQLITFVTLLLINDFRKVNQLIWVIVLSIGFFSVKGGLFTILTGGAHRVYGPSGSFINENNSLAVATLMIIPLLVYLYGHHKENVWLRRGILVAIVLSSVSVVGSQSRGALVAIVAVSGFFWLKTKGKLLSGLLIAIGGFVIVTFMPESWHARMDTIDTYQEDASAMGRLNAWEYSLNVANDRLTGAGFESWSTETFAIWAPRPEDVHAAHSIYFGVLADHGWPGLFLFLCILLITWRSLSKTIRQTEKKPDQASQNQLAKMLQVSLVAYMSGGAFLSLAYFDLPWHIVAISIILASNIEPVPIETSGANRGNEQTITRRGVAGHASRIRF